MLSHEMSSGTQISSEISLILSQFRSLLPSTIQLPFAATSISLMPPSSLLLSSSSSICIYDQSTSSLSLLPSLPSPISLLISSSSSAYIAHCEEISKYSLPGLIHEDTFSGHTSEVLCMAISQESLFSGSEDCTVRQWNLTTSIEIREKCLYSHSSRVQALDLSSDLGILASLGYDGLIKIYNLNAEAIVQELDCNYNSRVVKFSPNCTFLAACDKYGVLLWKVDTWEQLRSGYKQIHSKTVNSLDFTTDEKCLVTGCDSGEVGVTNISTYCTSASRCHSEGLTSMIVAGGFIYSVAGDNSLCKFSVQEPEGEFEMTNDEIFRVSCFVVVDEIAVVFGENKERSKDGQGWLEIWDVEPGEFLRKGSGEVTEFVVEHAVRCREFIICRCSEGVLRVVNTRGETVHTFEKNAELVSVDFDRIALCEDKNINIYKFPEFTAKLETVQRKSAPSCIALYKTDLFIGEYSGEIHMYNTLQSVKLKTLPGHTSKIIAIAACHSLKYLITSEFSDIIIIWDYGGFHCLQQLRHNQVFAIYFSQDLHYFYLCSRDQTIYFYSLSSLSLVSTLQTKYSASQMQVPSSESYILVKEIGSIYVLSNPLHSPSIGGTNYNKQAYIAYILKMPENSDYQPQMDYWVINPYLLNTLHFYAYYNMSDFLQQALSASSPFYASASGHTGLSIALDRNLDQCTHSLFKGLAQRLSHNPLSLQCVSTSLCKLNRSASPVLHKFYKSLFRESICPMPRFCSEEVPLPIISTSSTIYAEPQDFMQRQAYDNQGQSIKFFQSFVAVPVEVGARDSIEFLQTLAACENTGVFRCEIIKVILQEKWQRVKWIQYIDAGVYVWFLIMLSLHGVYQNNQVLEAGFCANAVLVGYEVMQAVACPPLYFVGVWNYLEIGRSLLFVVYCALVWTGTGGLDELLSIVIFLSWIRGITFFRLFSGTRYYLNLLISVFKDIIPFFTIYFYSSVGFALVFQSLDDNHSDYFSYLTGTYESELGSSATSGYSMLQWLVFLLLTVINQIVMMNLIISIMSDTYARVKENQIVADSLEIIGMLLEIEMIMLHNRRKNEKKYFHVCRPGNNFEEKDVRARLKRIMSYVKEFRQSVNLQQEIYSKQIEEVKISTSQSSMTISEIRRMISQNKY